MSGEGGGTIVGVIHHAASDTEKPEFEIIRREHDWRRKEEPCAHGKFVLDERWNTVTCGKCGERVDPFCALMRYAENFQAIVHRFEQMVESEKRLHVAELKRLSRLRGATEDERGEIARLTGWSFKGDVAELREAARRIRRAIDERKHTRRSNMDRSEPRGAEGQEQLYTPRVGGQPFRCPCGCNVFRKPVGRVWECNACGNWYTDVPEREEDR